MSSLLLFIGLFYLYIYLRFLRMTKPSGENQQTKIPLLRRIFGLAEILIALGVLASIVLWFAGLKSSVDRNTADISELKENIAKVETKIDNNISSIRQEISSIHQKISYIQGQMDIPHGSKTAFGKVNSIDQTKGILVIQETSGKNIELKLGEEVRITMQTAQGVSPVSLHNVTQNASIRVDFIEDPQTSVKEARAILIYKK